MDTTTPNNVPARKNGRKNRIFTNLAYEGNINIPTTIELIQYNQKVFSSKNIPIKDNLKNYIANDKVNWFKITGISDSQTVINICKTFGIQRFDIRDLLSIYHITKVIPYEHNTFILMSNCSIEESNHRPELYQIAFILGDNYIISFQETAESIFDDVKEAISESRLVFREKGADYLLYILLNDIHSSYNFSLTKLTDKIEEMEDKLIDDNTKGINVMKFIQYKKKEFSLLKREVSAMREEYANLLHNTNKLIKPENVLYFNDFDDKLRTSLDDLEMFHMSISSLTDLYFNNNNLRMNDVIKKLTIVSTIFIPLTFMVGVWGMNFDFMPELNWTYGYLFAWCIMIVIVIIALLFLKKKKWF